MANQNNLSEQLQLLQELQYSDLDLPYQTAGIHSNKESRNLDTNHEVRLLDTFAIALTTGNPGDVFAAAFDKRQHMQLVLAKNGPPTSEDVSAANEPISLIGNRRERPLSLPDSDSQSAYVHPRWRAP